ncbi:MAG: class I SAM-dependent methyltransferase, partial [Ensifer adhaerens]|nr:class I SAM-dependent methyltransferase [Ensifer adhaerens]
MKQTSHPPCQTSDWYEHAFDLARGIAAYTRSPLIEGIGRVIAKHPDAHIANAFNHKQVAC